MCSQIFTIQSHNASHYNYDLRLEIAPLLKSFALPKTPPTGPGIKRLAIQTEDHALEYANFDTKTPQGQYGAGTVTIWDRGRLVVEDFRENEKILFELSGNKMQGRYALIKTKLGGQKENRNWLLFKRK